MAHERRENDRQLADHEARLIRIRYELDRLLAHHTKDEILKRVHILEGAIELAYEKIKGVEDLHANTRGDKDSAFTDAQIKWLKEFYDERKQVDAGRTLFRLLWAAGLGAASALLTYLGIKGR